MTTSCPHCGGTLMPDRDLLAVCRMCGKSSITRPATPEDKKALRGDRNSGLRINPPGDYSVS